MDGYSRWYAIVIIVLGIIVAVIAGFSISAFWTVRQGQPVTPSFANALWVGNIILLLIAIGVVIWGLVMVFWPTTPPPPCPAPIVAPVAVPTAVVTAPTQAELTGYVEEEVANVPLLAPTQPYTAAQVLTSTSGAGSRLSESTLRQLQFATSGRY